MKEIHLLTAADIGLDTECTVDGTHPNDLGMMRYAEAYARIIRKILNK
jgi:lysophospholipase L1-like esterase